MAANGFNPPGQNTGAPAVPPAPVVREEPDYTTAELNQVNIMVGQRIIKVLRGPGEKLVRDVLADLNVIFADRTRENYLIEQNAGSKLYKVSPAMLDVIRARLHADNFITEVEADSGTYNPVMNIRWGV